jgi:hypothetical protein
MKADRFRFEKPRVNEDGFTRNIVHVKNKKAKKFFGIIEKQFGLKYKNSAIEKNGQGTWFSDNSDLEEYYKVVNPILESLEKARLI